MNWEQLTSPDFERAVKTSKGVCLLTTGVIEKHGDHLPLGMDMLYAHKVASIAARKAPAIVFPPYYFGQIFEARHVPGTVAIRSELLVPLLENVCDEIGRNGFDKIIIVNGHGGNNHLIRFFLQTLLEKEKSYMVFLSEPATADKAVRSIREAKIDGHGGEEETCALQYLYPGFTHAERFADYGIPLKRFSAFARAGLQSGIWWYADYPGHFAGERVKMNRKKGETFVKSHVAQLVKQINLVKKDKTPASLYREFFRRTECPANRYP